MGYAIRYPPVGPSSRAAPGGSVADAENTGKPAMPASKYVTWAAAPRREPSAAAPRSTTIGVSVKGTAVNGSGTEICAAAAVSATTRATASVRTIAGDADLAIE